MFAHSFSSPLSLPTPRYFQGKMRSVGINCNRRLAASPSPRMHTQNNSTDVGECYVLVRTRRTCSKGRSNVEMPNCRKKKRHLQLQHLSPHRLYIRVASSRGYPLVSICYTYIARGALYGRSKTRARRFCSNAPKGLAPTITAPKRGPSRK